METATQSFNSTTANQRLQRSAAQLLGGYNREMIARQLARKKDDGSPTLSPDDLKKIMRESFYKSLAMYHSDAPGFDTIYEKAAKKLEELVDSVVASMK